MKPLLPLLLCLGLAFSTSAQKQNWITVYTDDFSGAHYELGYGQYNHVFLLQSGISFLGSIKVPAGAQVILYAEDNFRGRSITLTEDARMRYLKAKGFAEIGMMVSMIVKPLPEGTPPVASPFITIYQHNFSGHAKNLAVGYYEAYDFGHIDNDQISSVKVPKGLQVTLYEHAGFKGKSLVLTADATADFLISKKFNDATSSLRVEELPTEVETKPVVVKDSVVTEPAAPAILSETVAIIYQDEFKGKNQQLKPGLYNLEDLNLTEKTISSIQLKPGYQVTLFDNENFKGRSLTLTADASPSFLAFRNFDNAAVSLIVEIIQQAQPVELNIVTLYENDFTGRSQKLAPGRYATSQLGIRNDALSSITVAPGFKVTLYEHGDFTGRTMFIRGQSVNAAFFNQHQFNDIASAVVVEEIPHEEQVVTIYSEKFSGKSQELEPGEYGASKLTIGENELTSLRVPKGFEVTLFEHGNFKGLKTIVDRDTDYSTSKMFNNIYSSVIVSKPNWPIEVTPVPVAPVPVVVPPVTPEPVIIRDTVVIIQQPAQPVPPPCILPESEYATALEAVRGKAFSAEKMQMAKLVTKDRCLTNDQIRGIAQLFSFEDQTLEFVQYAHVLALEKNTYYTLENVFKFMSSREKFTKFLSGKK
jgi:hypothetical protein